MSFSLLLEQALKDAQSNEKSKQWSIASQHLHSNSVLLASLDYRYKPTTLSNYSTTHDPEDISSSSDGNGVSPSDSEWNIWIDYNKFHQLIKNWPTVKTVEGRPNEDTNSSYQKHRALNGHSEITANDALITQSPISPSAWPLQFSSRLASLYTAQSPAWTLPSSELGGFDPQFDRQRWIQQLHKRQLAET